MKCFNKIALLSENELQENAKWNVKLSGDTINGLSSAFDAGYYGLAAAIFFLP